jgi:hypothetical protein
MCPAGGLGDGDDRLVDRTGTRPGRPTPASLAANHDLAAFLLPLYASLRESGTPEMQAQMLPGVTAALKALD